MGLRGRRKVVGPFGVGEAGNVPHLLPLRGFLFPLAPPEYTLHGSWCKLALEWLLSAGPRDAAGSGKTAARYLRGSARSAREADGQPPI